MSKPACFSQYVVGIMSPCNRCAWSGKCASNTYAGPFRIMANARYGRTLPKPVINRIDPSTAQDTALLDAAKTACIEAGFRFNACSYFVRTPSKQKIAKLVAGHGGVVFVRMYGVRVPEARRFHSAHRCEIIALRVPAVDSQSRQLRKRRPDLFIEGCYAVAMTVEDVVSVVCDAAAAFNH